MLATEGIRLQSGGDALKGMAWYASYSNDAMAAKTLVRDLLGNVGDETYGRQRRHVMGDQRRRPGAEMMV